MTERLTDLYSATVVKLIEYATAPDNALTLYLLALAHDLRGPLASIQTAVAMLRTECSPAQREILTLADDAIAALSGTVDNLSVIAEPTNARSRDVVATIEFPHMLGQVIEGLTHGARLRGLSFAVDHHPANMQLRSRPALLALLLRDALTQSMENAPPGTLITVEARHQHTLLALSIRDAGPGLPDGLAQTALQHGGWLSVRGHRSAKELCLEAIGALTRTLGGTAQLHADDGGSRLTLALPFDPRA